MNCLSSIDQNFIKTMIAISLVCPIFSLKHSGFFQVSISLGGVITKQDNPGVSFECCPVLGIESQNAFETRTSNSLSLAYLFYC